MTKEKANIRNRRRSQRIRARIRVLFTRAGTGVAIEAETDDVSVDGVFVRTRRRPPDVGTRLGLILKLDEHAQELMLSGIVTRVREGENESGQTSPGMGIQFVDMDDQKRKVLVQALEGSGEFSAPTEEADDAGS